MAGKLRSPQRRRPSHAARNFTIAVLCAAVMVGTLIYVGYGEKLAGIARIVAGFFFHPVSFVFLVALGLEYIVLKSADRSRLLRIELDKLREKRRGEVTRLRLTREGLERLKERTGEAGLSPAQVREAIDGIIDTLRPPETHMLEEENKKMQNEK